MNFHILFKVNVMITIPITIIDCAPKASITKYF